MTASLTLPPSGLSGMKGLLRGRRCFILGNGPSLNNTNLLLLENEITIGLNRIYMKFGEMGFSTTFLCCVNELVLQQFGQEIAETSPIKLLNASAAGTLPPRSDTVFMESIPGPGFATDLTAGAWHPGATVTLCALQLAFHLGIEDVVLLGVDHNFTQSGRAHRASRSRGADANHFDPNYFGKDTVWQFPDLVESELNYETAKEVFRIHGRSIRDGTVNGKLQIFEKAPGYGIGPTAEAAPAAAAIPPVPAAHRASMKEKIYQAVINTRHQGAIQAVCGVLIVVGLIGLGVFLARYPGLIGGLLALLSLLAGVGLLAGSVAADWLSEWSRRRRLREGRLLLMTLKMIQPPEAPVGDGRGSKES